MAEVSGSDRWPASIKYLLSGPVRRKDFQMSDLRSFIIFSIRVSHILYWVNSYVPYGFVVNYNCLSDVPKLFAGK